MSDLNNNPIVNRRKLREAVHEMTQTDAPGFNDINAVLGALGTVMSDTLGVGVVIETKSTVANVAGITDLAAVAVAHATIMLLMQQLDEAGGLNTMGDGYQAGADFLNNMLPKFKHTQSGGCYVKLLDAKDEATGVEKTVYMSDLATNNGNWVRDKEQFEDGRFVPIS